MALTLEIATVDRTSRGLSPGSRRSLQIRMSLGGEWTAEFPVFDVDSSASAYRPSLDQIVEWTHDVDGPIFYGRIVTVKDVPLAATSIGVETRVSARAGNEITHQTLVQSTYPEGETLEAVVTDLVSTYLAGTGITLDAGMATGPTLGALTFDRVTLGEALNYLTQLTGWVWRLTPGRVLEMFAVGDKTAAYSLTAANRLALGAVTWERTRGQYHNRIHLTYGTESQVQKTWTVTGNGTADTWTLDYQGIVLPSGTLLSQGYVADSATGSNLPLGVVTTDPTAYYNYNPATNEIVRTLGALPNLATATLLYSVQFPLTVVVEDATAIAANGLWEVVFDAPDIFDKDEAAALAEGLLRQNLEAPTRVTVVTREGFEMPGTVITLTFADRTISGDYLITDVSAVDVADGQMEYTFTCVSGSEVKRSWTHVLKDLLGGGGGTPGGGGTVSGSLIPSITGRFSDDVIAHVGTTAEESRLDTYQNATVMGPSVVLGRLTDAQGWAVLADFLASGSRPTLAFIPLADSSTYRFAMQLTRGNANVAGEYYLTPNVNSRLYIGGVPAAFGGSGAYRVDVDADECHAASGYTERVRTVKLGEWTAVAHNAGNFTASAGTWTVDSADQTTYAYTLVGLTMTIVFSIENTDVSTTPAQLRIAIPDGFVSARTILVPSFIYQDASGAGGAVGLGYVSVTAAGTYIALQKIDGTAWTATSSDNTNVYGQFTFEVQP